MAIQRHVVPVKGMDQKAWESDYVQFPRLLAMLAGDIGPANTISTEEIDGILKRAQKKWRRILDSYKPRGKRAKKRQAQFS